MIQPAATSANSSLLLGAVMPAGEAGDAAATVDFAALLGLEATPEQTLPATDPAAMLHSLTAARPATGKPSGKTLPDALPDERVTADDTPGESDAAPSDVAPEEVTAQPTLNEPLLALVNAVAAAPTLLPTPKAASPEVPAKESKFPAPAPAIIHTSAAATTLVPTPAPAVITSGARGMPLPASTAMAITARFAAVEQQKQPAAQQSPAAVNTVAAPSTVQTQALPADAVISVPQPQVRAAAPKQPEPAVPAALHLNAAAVLSKSTIEGVKPTPARERPSQPNTLAVVATPAPVEPALPSVTQMEPKTDRVATTAVASQVVAAAKQDKSTDAAASPAAAAPLQAKAEVQPPLAAELQPVIAMRDGQSNVSTQTSVATPAQPSPVAGHDFAKLIDRLVEARDAIVPQPVQTSVMTPEFGRISLRFEQDDVGMRVAMNSADPDFARAVQAAQPAAAAQTPDNNTGGQRQEAPGQQNAGSGFAASQNNGQASSQSQAQSSARNQQDSQDGPSRSTGRTARNSTDQDDADPRGGGIYA